MYCLLNVGHILTYCVWVVFSCLSVVHIWDTVFIEESGIPVIKRGIEVNTKIIFPISE